MRNLFLNIFLFSITSTSFNIFAAPVVKNNESPKDKYETFKLWPDSPPEKWETSRPETSKSFKFNKNMPKMKAVFNVTQPELTVIRPAPDKSNGAAMVVIPGGGFMMLSMSMEGYDIGKWLADRGITAFVLKYRVKDLNIPYNDYIKDPSPYKIPFDKYLETIEPSLNVSSSDALQAMRIARSKTKEYGLDKNKIGMIGFSAGAITTIRAIERSDNLDRPNFAASIYGASLHSPKVPSKIPLFIGHAVDDPSVPVEKSVQIYNAWKNANAPVEMHLYQNGGHGFGLGNPGTSTMIWSNNFESWLKINKIINSK